MYAVANACNFDNYVTPERLEESKPGNNIGQLSKWMQEDGHPFYIDALFYDHNGSKIPDAHCGYKPVFEDKPDTDNYFLPLIFSVLNREESKLRHMVGGKVAKDGTLFLYDSCKTEIIETTLAEVNDMYHHIYGLYIFNGLHPEAGYCFIM